MNELNETNLNNNILDKNLINNSTNEINFNYSDFLITLLITIIYGIIFISGLLGNVITCIVIAKNRGMHTATNYYLFSLAISDLLLLISGMPLETYDMWITTIQYPINEPTCITIKLVSETSANATVLTITAFTAERYIAICHPFMSHTMSKLSRAVKFIFAIWLLAMSLAVPQVWDVGITHHEYEPPYPEYVDCSHQNNNRRHFFTISVILCFVLPMFIITLFYMLIGLQLRRSKIIGRAARATGNSIKLKPFQKEFNSSKRHILLTVNNNEKCSHQIIASNGSQHPHFCEMGPIPGAHNHFYLENADINLNNSGSPARLIVCNEDGRKNYSHNYRSQGSGHVINMLVAVVVAFFICWAPHHVQRIYAMYADPNSDTYVFQIITQVSGILYYLSTCVNPLLYNIMSFKFREAFKASFLRHQCCTASNERTKSINSSRRILRTNKRFESSFLCNTKSSVKSTNSVGHQEIYLCTSSSCNSTTCSNILFSSTIHRPITVKFKKTKKECIEDCPANIKFISKDVNVLPKFD